MENDKYYIPDIEDLYVGYECQADDNVGEFAVEICATEERLNYMWLSDAKHPNAYYKCLTGKDISRYEGGNVCHNGFIPLVLRTKYLDKGDIESLGWKFNRNYKTKLYFETEDIWEPSVKGGFLDYDTDTKILKIVLKTGGVTADGPEIRESFCGLCPSKNELKKLIKLFKL